MLALLVIVVNGRNLIIASSALLVSYIHYPSLALRNMTIMELTKMFIMKVRLRRNIINTNTIYSLVLLLIILCTIIIITTTMFPLVLLLLLILFTL